MIGRMDQRIEIERQLRVPDGGGGKTLAWQPLPNDPRPWAKVELLEGNETVLQATQRARFVVRSRDDLQTGDRIKWGGMVWNIRSLGRPVARAMYQTIEAVAGELSA